MFLDCEQARVERNAEELELRHPSCPCASEGKGEELSYDLYEECAVGAGEDGQYGGSGGMEGRAEHTLETMREGYRK